MSVVSGMMGASASKSAARKQAKTQKEALEWMKKVYEEQRADFEPYRGMGLSAIPYIMSAMTGKPYESMVTGYTALKPEEITSLNKSLVRYDPNKQWYRTPQGNIVSATTGMVNTGELDPNMQPIYKVGDVLGEGWVPITGAEISQYNKQYDLNQQWYRGPDGQIVSASDVPTESIMFEPGQSPAAKYALERGNVALMRSLGARGLAGGGTAPVKLADLSKSVAASDWQDQYNRLLDLVKIGTGSTAATGSASNTMSQGYQNTANNLSNIYGQQGQNLASIYGNMSGNAISGVGTGLATYGLGNQLGWWGSSAGATSGAAAAGTTLEAGEIAMMAA